MALHRPRCDAMYNSAVYAVEKCLCIRLSHTWYCVKTATYQFFNDMRTSAPFRLVCRFRQVSSDAINVFASIVCCDYDDDDALALDDNDALKYNKLSYHKQVALCII